VHAGSDAIGIASVIVRVPGLLRSYTAGVESVDIDECRSVADALAVLDTRFPGIRFRIVDEQGGIRPHIKLFADAELVRHLATPTQGCRELMIVGALSGG
jgi:hypothetical protein